jgi:aminotransferase in exopolysaccharide biosynthesis
VLPERVTRALAEVIGERQVALHEPRFEGNESKYLQECLESTFVSSVGPFVDRFEAELAQYTGVEHAVAVVNGTAALHVAQLLAGVQPGDEVLVPALTFVATANAVRYCNAIPHFVDSSLTTLGLDPMALRRHLAASCVMREGHCINKHSGRIVRAVVPMHTFGHPMDIDTLLEVAREFHLAVVEDAAESLGSTWHGRHTGGFGLLGTLSFNGNKIITTGGGGAILTNDSDLARRAKHLTTTAKLAHRWAFEHDEVGYNYRMPNINAALGVAQLERLPSLIAAKRRLYERYAQAFNGLAGARLFVEPAGSSSNYWLQTLLLDEEMTSQRDMVLAMTNDAGYMTRPVWSLMYKLSPYAGCPRMETPVAENLVHRIINLPSSPGLV